MALYSTRSQLEGAGFDLDAIVQDQIDRQMQGLQGNPEYDKYSTGVFLGANDKEGRSEDYFFITIEDYNEWLTQN